MNTTIVFTVKNRRISSDTKSIDLIGDNMDYTAVFDLDEDMASERIKTARFIKDDVQQERILDDNNSCQIPPELLKNGYLSVGIYTDEKSTTPCFLQIARSIRETDYPVKDPEPDVYRQLLEKIEKLKGLREIELRADEKNIQWRYVGEEEWKELISFSDIAVSPEEIKQAVQEYLKDNPLEETDPTVPDWAKEPQKPTYTAEEVGALPASKLPEAIDVALAQAKASGEFDGAPGEKGDPGPKGDPGETTYVENPYDDTQLKNDIGKLKEDKLTKPADPPTVGKILKVKSVNEDGTFVCEWADGGSDLDVQINGQSIVQNSVAEIPLCTKTKGAGLITIDTYSNNGGLYKANESTGLIRIMCANERNISARNNAFTPIVPFNFDYTVKAAMTDGKGAAWTAEEQAAARERMGICWKKLVDVTTEEDATKFTYTFNECNEIIIMISGESTDARINFTSDGITNFYHYSFLLANKVSTNYMHIHPRIGSMRYIESGFVSTDTPDSNAPYALINSNSSGMVVKSLNDKINNLNFDINSTKILKANSRIQIFGR